MSFGVKSVLIAVLAAFSVIGTGCRNYTDITETGYRGPALCHGLGGALGNMDDAVVDRWRP